VARLLTAEIESGRYKVGQKIPTEAELQQRFDVSRHTVREALRDLKARASSPRAPAWAPWCAPRRPAHALHAGHRHAEGADPVRRGHAHEGAEAPRADRATRTGRAARREAGQEWHEASVLRFLPRSRTPVASMYIYVRPSTATCWPDRQGRAAGLLA
jgi:DNA-binding transcriptional MocR family regulator